MIRADRLITDCRLATMLEGGEAYGAVEDGAILIRDGDIAWVGARADLPAHEAAQVDRLDGRWVTPGLIDCHTHLVFGGDRSGEFEQRLGGATYEEIARAGGGIVSSVRMTREASEDDLVASALKRLAGLKASGVTTVEIKSGYGLDRDSELKMLRAARRVGAEGGVRVATSYLGLHAVPPEFREDRAAYVDLAVDEILPAAHAEGLVDAVDAYCEPIAFSTDEVGRLFERRSRWACRSSCTPTSCRTAGGRRWRRDTAPCRRITSNMPTRPGSRPWPRRASWPCCCPAPSLCCGKRRRRPSRRCAAMG